MLLLVVDSQCCASLTASNPSLSVGVSGAEMNSLTGTGGWNTVWRGNNTITSLAAV